MSRYIDVRNTQVTPQGFNAETEKIANTQQDHLSRKAVDGPNQMETTLDMNSERIINLPAPQSDSEPLTFGSGKQILDKSTAQANRAEQEADRAEQEANSAASSAALLQANLDDKQDEINQAAASSIQQMGVKVGEVETSKNQSIQQINTILGEVRPAFNDAISSLTVPSPFDFTEGGTVTARNQAILWPVSDGGDGSQYRWDGELPKEVPPNSTPDSTGGEGAGAWVDVGQAALRSDLANEGGASLVRGTVFTVDSLIGLRNAPQREGQQVSVKGFYAGSDVGGGVFYWDASRDKAEHNVGTVIDPARVMDWDGTQEDLATLFEVTESGFGCFVRLNTSVVSAHCFGGVLDGVADDSEVAEQIALVFNYLLIPDEYSLRLTRKITSSKLRVIFGGGEIFVDQSDYTGAFLLPLDNSLVKEVSFRGTGNQSDVNSVNILDLRGTRPIVEKCRFYEFKLAGFNRESALINTTASTGAKISGNFFAESNYGFNDIRHGTQSGNTQTVNNLSYSNSDYFCSVAAFGGQPLTAGSAILNTSHHVISGNIHIKNKGARAEVGQEGRHGILLHYGDHKSYSTVTNNIMVNCGRHGIYCRAGNDEDAGPDIISNNIIRFCGGQSADGDYANASIRAETGSNNSLYIQNNIVEYAGYYPDLVKRENRGLGLGLTSTIGNIHFNNNSVTSCNGMGVRIDTRTSGSSLKRAVNISGNSLKNIENSIAMYITLPARAFDFDKFGVYNNNIEHYYIPAEGVSAAISFRAFVDSPAPAEFYFGVIVEGNDIRCENTKGVGIAFDKRINRCLIKKNRIHGAFQGIAAYATLEQPSAFNHKELGVNFIVDENIFIDTITPVRSNKGSVHNLAFIGKANKFIGCTNLPSYELAGTTSYSLGEVNRVDGNDDYTVEVLLSRAPTNNAWKAGDKIINPSPAAGGYMGWICVESGTPGVWKGYGAIEA